MTEHDQRVKSLVAYMDSKGINIHAAVYPDSPYPEPKNIGRHEPDVVGSINGGSTLVIGEAKTEEDYNADHSKEQYYDFGISSANEVFVHLPLVLHNELRNILRELGVNEKYTLVCYTSEKE